MKLNSDSLKKLKRYQKLIKALWYIGIMGGIFLVIVIILNRAGIKTGNLGLKLDFIGISIKVDRMYLDSSIFFSMQLALVIFWGLYMYIVNKIKNIIDNTIKKETPFLKENIIYLKHMSYSFFVSAGLIVLLEIITGLSMISDNIFNEINRIEGIEMQQVISMPEWPIVTGLLILLLAEIFKHGYQLQQDSEAIV